MTYKILCAEDAEELETAVASFMADGWAPHGGVAVALNDYYSEDHKGQTNDNFSRVFAQAMVKD